MNNDSEIVEMRQLFPVTEHWTYLYNGGIHPCPRPIADAMRTFLAQWESGGRAGWSSAFDAFERVRDRFAGLLHADRRNIVVTESTTAGIRKRRQRNRRGDRQVAALCQLSHA
jgi:selenocysteine lyase/cysteine desulfurase